MNLNAKCRRHNEREKRQAMMKNSIFNLAVGSYFQCHGSKKKNTGQVSSVFKYRQFSMNMNLLVAYRINCKDSAVCMYSVFCACTMVLCVYVCVSQGVYECVSHSFLTQFREETSLESNNKNLIKPR